MPSVDLNLWAIIAAAVINMVVGAVWYRVFAKGWAKGTGKKMDEMGDGAKGYVVAAVGALVMAVVLRYVIGWAGVTTAGLGAWVGVLVWLGFVAVTMASGTVFEGRSWNLWGINSLYYLVVLVINGALLATWI